MRCSSLSRSCSVSTACTASSRRLLPWSRFRISGGPCLPGLPAGLRSARPALAGASHELGPPAKNRVAQFDSIFSCPEPCVSGVPRLTEGLHLCQESARHGAMRLCRTNWSGSPGRLKRLATACGIPGEDDRARPSEPIGGRT